MNKIKTNGAMMVTELLFTHDKLLSLNLGNNKIDHDGIIGILSVLNSSNYTLEELNIQGRESFMKNGGENFDLIVKFLSSNYFNIYKRVGPSTIFSSND